MFQVHVVHTKRTMNIGTIDKEEHLFNTSALSTVVSKTSRYIVCQA